MDSREISRSSGGVTLILRKEFHPGSIAYIKNVMLSEGSIDSIASVVRSFFADAKVDVRYGRKSDFLHGVTRPDPPPLRIAFNYSQDSTILIVKAWILKKDLPHFFGHPPLTFDTTNYALKQLYHSYHLDEPTLVTSADTSLNQNDESSQSNFKANIKFLSDISSDLVELFVDGVVNKIFLIGMLPIVFKRLIIMYRILKSVNECIPSSKGKATNQGIERKSELEEKVKLKIFSCLISALDTQMLSLKDINNTKKIKFVSQISILDSQSRIESAALNLLTSFNYLSNLIERVPINFFDEGIPNNLCNFPIPSTSSQLSPEWLGKFSLDPDKFAHLLDMNKTQKQRLNDKPQGILTNIYHLPFDLVITYIIMPLLKDIINHPDKNFRNDAVAKMKAIQSTSWYFWRACQLALPIYREELAWRWVKTQFPGDVSDILASARHGDKPIVGWIDLYKNDCPLQEAPKNILSIPECVGFEVFAGSDCSILLQDKNQASIIPLINNPFTNTTAPFLHSLPFDSFKRFHMVIGRDEHKRPFLAFPCEYTFDNQKAWKGYGVSILQRMTTKESTREIWLWISQVPFHKNDYNESSYHLTEKSHVHALTFAIFDLDSTEYRITSPLNDGEKAMQMHFLWLNRLFKGLEVGWLLKGCEGLSDLNKSNIRMKLYKHY